jgi:hypothetical protein
MSGNPIPDPTRSGTDGPNKSLEKALANGQQAVEIARQLSAHLESAMKALAEIHEIVDLEIERQAVWNPKAMGLKGADHEG